MDEVRAQLMRNESLTIHQSEELFDSIFLQKINPALTKDILVSLSKKGETKDEILGALKSLEKHMIAINTPDNAIDVCGTGGDGTHTFNISTATAFLAHGAGATIAKHGNKGVSSKSGSSDVLEELNIRTNLTPKQVEECIAQTGLGFMFAPNHHPILKIVAPLRKEIGKKTIFNLLGPLANPARIKRQLIGVYDPKYLQIFAEVLKARGAKHALIVNNNGCDEILLKGKTNVCELKDGEIKEYALTAKEFGLDEHSLDELIVSSPKESAAKIRDIMELRETPARDVVLANTAAALLIAGIAKDFKDGIQKTIESIEENKAYEKYFEVVEFTNSVM